MYDKTISRSAQYSYSVQTYVQAQELRFRLVNTGDTAVSLSWRTPDPLTIEPQSITDLAPGQTHSCLARFTATDAVVIAATATCTLSTGSTHAVKLTAIGKFPRLTLDTSHVDHEMVLVGQTARRTVALQNHSPVPARFDVRYAGSAGDNVLAVAPICGTVQPGQSAALSLRYKPAFAGTTSTETFSIVTPAGTAVQLTQTGVAVGAAVSASAQALDFGDVKLGNSTKQVRSILEPLHAL